MSHDAINGEQFKDFKLSYTKPEMGQPQHKIVAHTPEGHVAGFMEWHAKTHEVQGVTVHPEHQRQGLATAMWNMGQGVSPRPKHSADRTDAGEAWSKSVGGPRPRRLPRTTGGSGASFPILPPLPPTTRRGQWANP